MAALLFTHPRLQIKPAEPEGPVYVENTTDRLNVLLYCQSSDYFLYRGAAIGFQYELLKMMGDSLGKEIQFTFTSDEDEVTENFFTSNYDIIAFDIEPDQPDADKLLFSLPHSQSHPVLLRNVKAEADSVAAIFSPRHHPFRITADSLPQTTLHPLYQTDSLEVEELIDLLQDDSIEYVVADYNTAIMLEPFYSAVEIVKSVGPTYPRAWILNPANKKFNDQLNTWLASFKQTTRYEKLCDKYFHPHSSVLRGASPERRRGRISSYDKTIQNYSQKKGVDWRLVSSIIYEESHFSCGLTGFGGSYGIMQMMPGTAAAYGIDSTSSVSQQLYAGVCMISHFNRMFKGIEDEQERANFIAASYNAGAGHILDARALCRKYGGDPDVWLDVAPYLIKKSDRKYYTDPVVKCGYYPGKHTVNYTKKVVDRYHAYRISLPSK